MDEMKPRSYYSPDGDLAVIHVRAGEHVRTEEQPWGLLDFDTETDELASVEVWNASKVLPRELLDALPRLSRADVVIEREYLAKQQTV